MTICICIVSPVMHSGPGGCCICNGFSSQLKNHKLGKLQFFIMGCRKAYAASALKKDTISVTLGVQKPVFSKEKCYLYLPKIVLYKHPWKNEPEYKRLVPLSYNMYKCKRPSNCLPTSLHFLSYKMSLKFYDIIYSLNHPT